MADPDRFLLQPDVAADWGALKAPVEYVRKNGDGTWPDRPTNDPATLVAWLGPDPSPPGATAPAVNGMYPNDLRIIAPVTAEGSPSGSSPVASVDGRTGAVDLSDRYAGLDGQGRVLPAQLPTEYGTFGRDRGAGTALPTTDLRRGDVYFHTVLACLMTYTGIAWRQVTKPTYANRAALPAASGLYDGFTGFVTSKNVDYRVWTIGGTLTWKSASPFGQIRLTGNWTPATGDQGVTAWPTAAQYDTDNMWSGSASGNFVIPVPGIYRVAFRFAVTVAAGFLVGRVNRNPNVAAPYTGSVIASDGDNVSSTGSDEHRNAVGELALVAGDKIGAQIYSSAAPTIGTGWEGTSLTVEYLGPTPSSSTTA